jgi:transcriptional regulator with XRE-family HTH domain
MLDKLGNELRKAREGAGISLAAAAAPAKISAAYLHKLERGVVDSPSPRVLARIASVLKISYLRLMKLAGYLDEEQFAQALMRETAAGSHPLAGRQLTPEEWQVVAAFIKSLLAQRKQKAPGVIHLHKTGKRDKK